MLWRGIAIAVVCVTAALSVPSAVPASVSWRPAGIDRWPLPAGLRPRGVAMGPDGGAYVTGTMDGSVGLGVVVVRVAADGRIVQTWDLSPGSPTPQDGKAQGVADIAVAPTGEVVITDQGFNRVQVFSPDGRFLRRWGHNGGDGSEDVGHGGFKNPMGVAVSPAGEVAVGDQYGVQRFTLAGTLIGSAPASLLAGGAPHLAYESAASLWIPITAFGRLARLDTSAGSVTGGFPTARRIFAGAGGDAEGFTAGPSGNPWLVDSENGALLQYSPSGSPLRSCRIGDPEAYSQSLPLARRIFPVFIAMNAAGDAVVTVVTSRGPWLWRLRGLDAPGALSCLAQRPRPTLTLAVPRTVYATRAAARRHHARAGSRIELAVSPAVPADVTLDRCAATRRGHCRRWRTLRRWRWHLPTGTSRRGLPLSLAGRSLTAGRYRLSVEDATGYSPNPARTSDSYRLVTR